MLCIQDNPPSLRSKPLVVTTIAWSRHLSSRIEIPMKTFRETKFIMQSKVCVSVYVLIFMYCVLCVYMCMYACLCLSVCASYVQLLCLHVAGVRFMEMIAYNIILIGVSILH